MSRVVCEHWNQINNCKECDSMKTKEQRWYTLVNDNVAQTVSEGEGE